MRQTNHYSPNILGWPDDFLHTYVGLDDSLKLPSSEVGSDDDTDSDAECEDRDQSFGDSAWSYLRSLRSRVRTMSYSTAFSGIDSPGTSFAQIRAALIAATRPRNSDIHPEHVHAMEPGFIFQGVVAFVLAAT